MVKCETRDIVISGAGIAGLSLPRQLKRGGIVYLLIEKKLQLDATKIGIALPANAVHALRHMGLSAFVDKLHASPTKAKKAIGGYVVLNDTHAIAYVSRNEQLYVGERFGSETLPGKWDGKWSLDAFWQPVDFSDK